jgi:hypothetical protein
VLARLQPEWLPALGTYLGVIGGLNLVWEVLQLPFYTIWTTGTLAEQAFAVVHCTGGDLLIASSALVAALLIRRARGWPREHVGQVAVLAVAIGIAYTAFSEWLNVYVRQSWAYSNWMPTVPLGAVRIGLSPLLQWLVVPALAFFAVHANVVARSRSERPAAHDNE